MDLAAPELLDVYSCRGGATKGYQEAGFRVTGVDINPQPDYPGDEFVQSDAVRFLLDNAAEIRRRFVFVHASPPCTGEGGPAKGSNRARNEAKGKTYPRLIAPTRAALEFVGVPYVIENVAGSSVRKDLRLCGEMFGLGVIMHRFFELGAGAAVAQPEHRRHRGRVRGWRQGQYHDGPYVAAYGNGGGKATAQEIREAKGIDWTWDHLALRDALPPSYTRHIGKHIMGQIGRGAA